MTIKSKWFTKSVGDNHGCIYDYRLAEVTKSLAVFKLLGIDAYEMEMRTDRFLQTPYCLIIRYYRTKGSIF